MLVGPGVAEISEYTVAHILGNEAVETGDRLRDAFVISADHRTQILGVEPGRESGRAYEVGEHDRELAAFGFGSLAVGERSGSSECSVVSRKVSARNAAIASKRIRRWP